METLGLLGFVFGISAFVQILASSARIKKLEDKVKWLEGMVDKE